MQSSTSSEEEGELSESDLAVLQKAGFDASQIRRKVAGSPDSVSSNASAREVKETMQNQVDISKYFDRESDEAWDHHRPDTALREPLAGSARLFSTEKLDAMEARYKALEEREQLRAGGISELQQDTAECGPLAGSARLFSTEKLDRMEARYKALEEREEARSARSRAQASVPTEGTPAAKRPRSPSPEVTPAKSACRMARHGSRARGRGRGGRAAQGKIAGLTIEQHRRALGDKVKANISVEKWAIQARTHATTTMPVEAFRALLVPHASTVIPETFEENDPVVVATIKGSAAIGEVCVAKVRLPVVHGWEVGMLTKWF
eukprot:TRINITY_DN15181_c0_g1_i4.p1 TRINITY_DN15181_c0_g1~~TRINITY_DN15181_c0_g1_i4.p1  ORF type:complete len:362 (+),score=67.22 TRINITY_DN15181_c0_g1_i4:127-1086(+)